MNWAHSLLRLFHRLAHKPAPLRCALLDTGELILVDGQGGTQILSTRTTDLIRDVLAAAECSTPLMLGETVAGDLQTADEGPLPGGPGRTLHAVARGREGAPA